MQEKWLMPSTEYLRTLFSFNPLTGAMYWNLKRGNASAGKFAGRWDSKGYIEIRVDGVLYKAHRLIYKWMYGVDPEHLTVDHINCVKDCNRPWNLQLLSMKENASKGQTSWA